MEKPFNNIPPLIVVLVVAIAAIELVLTLADNGILGGPQGIGWRVAAIEDYAFSPLVWDYVTERSNYSPELIRRFVTYPWVHTNFAHALFASALLLALGKYVGEAWHWVSVLFVLVASMVSGALAHAYTAADQAPLLGFYAPVYGLIGALTYMLWIKIGEEGGNQWTAFTLIGVLVGLQLVFALLYGSAPNWASDIAGFVTGLILAPVAGPGGWRRLLNWIRQR